MGKTFEAVRNSLRALSPANGSPIRAGAQSPPRSLQGQALLYRTGANAVINTTLTLCIQPGTGVICQWGTLVTVSHCPAPDYNEASDSI